MPASIPFTQFCKMAPPSPTFEYSRSSSLGGSPITPTFDDQPSGLPSPPSLIIPASEGAAALKLPPVSRGSFEKQIVPVLRGRGTGFEILKPGSLITTEPSEVSASLESYGPPISLHNAYRERPRSVEGRRKLQKRRTGSVDSAASAKSSARHRSSLQPRQDTIFDAHRSLNAAHLSHGRHHQPCDRPYLHLYQA